MPSRKDQKTSKNRATTAFNNGYGELVICNDGPPQIYEHVKDDGKPRVQAVPGGAVREDSSDKPRIGLIPPIPLLQLGQHYGNGGKKYPVRNWEKGLPLSSFIESAGRHYAAMMMGKTDENHPIAVAWNMFGYVHTKYMIDAGVLPKELDDMDEVFEQYRKAR